MLKGVAKHHGKMQRELVDHTYRDYSHVDVEDLIADYKGVNDNLFPVKLHKILSTPEYHHIIQWKPHGRAWIIKDKHLLSTVVLPSYFNHGNFESFNRSVNGWAFKRLLKDGPDAKCYYHEMFLRGRPELTAVMKRAVNPGKKLPNKEGEPDFYELSKKYPLRDAAAGAALPVADMVNERVPTPPQVFTPPTKVPSRPSEPHHPHVYQHPHSVSSMPQPQPPPHQPPPMPHHPYPVPYPPYPVQPGVPVPPQPHYIPAPYGTFHPPPPPQFYHPPPQPPNVPFQHLPWGPPSMHPMSAGAFHPPTYSHHPQHASTESPQLASPERIRTQQNEVVADPEQFEMPILHTNQSYDRGAIDERKPATARGDQGQGVSHTTFNYRAIDTSPIMEAGPTPLAAPSSQYWERPEHRPATTLQYGKAEPYQREEVSTNTQAAGLKTWQYAKEEPHHYKEAPASGHHHEEAPVSAPEGGTKRKYGEEEPYHDEEASASAPEAKQLSMQHAHKDPEANEDYKSEDEFNPLDIDNYYESPKKTRKKQGWVVYPSK